MDYTSYRHIHYNSRKRAFRLWTWDKNTGERIIVDKPFSPYIYLETANPKDADANSIYNTPLRKVTFNNSFDRHKYVKDGGLKRIFYNLQVEQQILIDEFGKHNQDKDFSQFPLKIFTVDIETYSPDAFPEPAEAKDPITLITIHDSLTDHYHTWGTKSFYPNDEESNVTYYHCNSEVDILRSFIKFWRKDFPDIVTGWNIDGFDIPYLINRITNILGEGTAESLSPVDKLRKRENVVLKFGKVGVKWSIEGLSIIDYMDLYMTFSRGKQESYKLDHIGEVELGKGKLAFNATGLSQLQDTDWDTFVRYNIQDTAIVSGLERKLQFLMLVRMLAYLGMTNFEAALGTVSIVTGALALQALSKNMIIPTFPKGDVEAYDGGYVKNPNKGLHEAIVSFDANSLYPNTIITLNISPETKLGKILKTDDEHIELLLANEKRYTLTHTQFAEFVKQQDVAISKAKILFSQKHKGFCPELVDIIYADRVKDKKEQKSLKLKRSKLENEDEIREITKDIDHLEIMQYTKKILLNRLYGTFANKYSPFSDVDIASSITLTGQAVVKQAAEIGLQFAKDHGVDEDINIYSDTDSCYFTFKSLLKTSGIDLTENGKITKPAYDIIEEFGKFLNDNVTIWAQKNLNTKDSRFVFKRESICDAAIFFERKKRYILHILDDEGIACNKTKYTGVEIASTSTPAKIKPLIKKIVKTVLETKNYHATQKAYRDAYNKYKKLSIQDIASPRGIKGLEKYQALATGLNVGKGTPIHCKAAIYYNKLITDLGVDNKYEKIKSGDKIKYFYTAKNKYGISCIGFLQDYPPEFGIDIDYEMMFNKSVYKAVERLYDALGWRVIDLNEEPINDLLSLLS